MPGNQQTFSNSKVLLRLFFFITTWLIVSVTVVTAAYDENVYQAQRRLSGLGYDPGPADGVWGQKARAAVEKYQKDKGFAALGRLDDSTLSALRLDWAIVLYKQEKYQDAISELKVLLLLVPSYLDAQYWLGQVLEKKEQIQEAIALYQGIARQHRDARAALERLQKKPQPPPPTAGEPLEKASSVRNKPKVAGNSPTYFYTIPTILGVVALAMVFLWPFPRKVLKRADKLRAQGELNAAKIGYEQVIRRVSAKAARGTPRACRLMGHACLGLGHVQWESDAQAAIGNYQQARALGDVDANSITRLAVHWFERGDFTAAIDLLESWLPSTAMERLLLGRAYLKQGQAALAVRHFRTAHRMQRDWWEPLYYRGCALGWLGKYHSAVASFSHALQRAPEETRIHIQRGQAYYKIGRLEEALQDYRQAEANGELDHQAALVLAAVLIQREEFTRATEVLSGLVTRRQHLPVVHVLRGHMLEKQKEFHEAVAAYTRAAEAPPTAAIASSRVGILLTKLGKYREASAWLERARQQGVHTDAVLFYAGWCCYQVQAFQECLSHWFTLSQRHPGRQGLRHLVLKAKYRWGCQLVDARHYAAAIPLWEEYWTSRYIEDPMAQGLAELHIRVAAEKVQEGSIDGLLQAKEHLETGWELAPADPRFPHYLALLEVQDGHPEEAADLFEQAVAIAPDDSRLRYYLSLCRIEIGEVEEAETELMALTHQESTDPWSEPAAWALVALYTRQARWSEASDLLLARASSSGYGNI